MSKRSFDVGLLQSAWTIMRDFVGRYPKASAITAVGLVVAGAIDGLGMLTLLPLLETISSNGTPENPSGAAAFMLEIMDTLGIPKTIPGMVQLFVLSIILKGLLLYAAHVYMQSVIVTVKRDIRMNLMNALTQVRWEYFAEQQAGRLSNLLIQESAGTSALAKATLSIGTAGFTTLAYLASVLFLSWQFAIFAAVAGLTVALILQGFVRVMRRDGQEYVELSRDFSGRLVDWLSSLKPLKAMGLDKRLSHYIAEKAEQLARVERRLVIAGQGLVLLREPLGAIAIGGMLVVAHAYMGIPIASLTVSIALFWRMATRIGELQKSLSVLAQQEHNFYGVQDSLKTLGDMREAETAGAAPPAAPLSLRFDGVSYTYGPGKPAVLHSISADIKPGLMNVLVGPSGAGKSTCLDLIGALIRPSEGRILVNGTDLATLDVAAWRSRIGYMPQEMVLLHDTIRANLTLNDPLLDDDKVRDSLRAAGALEFVDLLANGLDTVVGERGSSLSGGQRQRLALARALIRKPDLLLLDEATSALDTESEARLCEHLETLLPDITIVATTHRPALLERAGHVIRITKGHAREEDAPANQVAG